MAHDDQRAWLLRQSVALEITCVAVDPYDLVTHVGGPNGDGSMWRTSVDSLIEAIQCGTRYYLRIEGNAYAVTVGRDHDGKPALNAGLKETFLLNLLPRFPA